MYRTGHGDCFLIAFAGKAEDKPAYVLIDCGYKPGSPKFINTSAKRIGESIRMATGGHVDVAVITHEHQDHVNGITEANFKGVTIGEVWLAWTEDPEDPLANRLRVLFKDKLLGLIAARNRLAAAGEEGLKQAHYIDNLLEFELGGNKKFNLTTAAALFGANGNVANSMNKKSMKLFKDRAEKGIRYLRPHQEILPIPGAGSARAFALGPPRDEEQLRDLDPQGEEAFHRFGLAAASPGNYFAAATRGGEAPFAKRYCIALADAPADPEHGEFFRGRYGNKSTPLSYMSRSFVDEENQAPDNPEWRRIDDEWLYSAEQLALDMNDYTNNASLVLAFELGKGGKVLLFAADAQRGNWVSWARADWNDGAVKVAAKDLLARTVLYKVGHHGSHNATLNGDRDSPTPNLAWMAQGEHAREFTAMITAVRAWAETQKGWDHPLKSIKDALLVKASGRVFQTDTPVAQMKIPANGSVADWNRFQARCTGHALYFDYRVTNTD
jgi:beta-lactamase superfamily II metal-dependent hydrolase